MQPSRSPRTEERIWISRKGIDRRACEQNLCRDRYETRVSRRVPYTFTLRRFGEQRLELARRRGGRATLKLDLRQRAANRQSFDSERGNSAELELVCRGGPRNDSKAETGGDSLFDCLGPANAHGVGETDAVSTESLFGDDAGSGTRLAHEEDLLGQHLHVDGASLAKPVVGRSDHYQLIVAPWLYDHTGIGDWTLHEGHIDAELEKHSKNRPRVGACCLN